MNLTLHFTLEELTFSDTAIRKGIDNTPSSQIIANLTTLAIGLEDVRKLLNAPIRINSGYRSSKLNAAIGGAKQSAHMEGYAADFTCSEFGTPLEIVTAIKDAGIECDKCIFEGSWVHVSFDPQARKQFMTAHFGAGGTTYTMGV